MKKRIVYFLCNIGLLKIANLISPSLVAIWKIERAFMNLRKSIDIVSEAFKAMANGLNNMGGDNNVGQ